jgi:hypothetical protein
MLFAGKVIQVFQPKWTRLEWLLTPANLMRSTDSGATFSALSNSGTGQWSAITSSSDGTKIVASVTNGNIYYSSDSGASWSALTAAGSKNWTGIKCSNDCSTIAAITGTTATGLSDTIYISYDYGSTWTALSSLGYQNWKYLSMSGDGSRIFAGADNGNTIYGSLSTTTVGVGVPASSNNGLIKLIHAGLNKFIVTEYKNVIFY